MNVERDIKGILKDIEGGIFFFFFFYKVDLSHVLLSHVTCIHSYLSFVVAHVSRGSLSMFDELIRWTCTE